MSAGEVRIAIIGTSQTYGEGAELLRDTLAVQIHQGLAATKPEGSELVTFNLAIHGSTSGALLDTYEANWERLSPDLVIVILSYNDPDKEALSENLRRLSDLSRRSGARIFFVLEPTPRRLKSDTQTAMARVGRQLGIPVADLHRHMNSDGIRDSGFLWWDDVHMTSLGQSEAATWLVPQLRPILWGGPSR